MKAIQTNTKIAEWNTQLAHRLRVADEDNDRLKVRVVLMTGAGLVLGFVIGRWLV